MSGCIFCKIVDKVIPAKIIYEGDDLMAFHDRHPAAPIHFLIIPKEHIPSLADCKAHHMEVLGKMALLAPRLAEEQGCGYCKSDANGGFKAMYHTGPEGGQEIYHLHLHVLGKLKPRFDKGHQ